MSYWQSRKNLFRYLLWFAIINTVAFWLINYKFLANLLSAKTLFGTTFFVYHGVVGKSVVLLFALMTYLGHFALLAFLPQLCISLPILFFCRHKFILFFVSVFSASLTLFLLLIDQYIFLHFHFHLNYAILNIAFAEQLNVFNFLELSHYEIYFILFIFSLIIVMETLFCLFTWKRIIVREHLFYEKHIIAFLTISLYGSYTFLILSIAAGNNVLAQQTPNFPLYTTFLAKILPVKKGLNSLELFSESRFSQPLWPIDKLQYPLHPLQFQSNGQHKKLFNIIIVGIDAWRFDSVSKVLMPNIYQFATHSVQFTQHFSGGNSTQAGLFSLFYSLPSSYWSSMLKSQQGAIFIDQLLKHNYQLKILYSSDISIPPIDKTVFNSIKNLPGGMMPGETVLERDHYITEEFKNFINHCDSTKPFFAFLFYDAVHNYCNNPDILKKYPVTAANCNRINLQTNNKDYLNHYKNALNFADQQFKELYIALQKKNLLQDTIIIITGDHGEEFDDNHQGYFGHGSNYTHYQVQTPLIVYWPRYKPTKINYVTTHYDIVPTLMRKVLNCQNALADYSVGTDLFDSRARKDFLVGSYVNMGIIEPNKIVTLLTSGDIRISDLNAIDLPNEKMDSAILSSALKQMRIFYRNTN